MDCRSLHSSPPPSLLPPYHGATAPNGFIIEALRSHLDTPHSVGLLCTSNESDADTSRLLWNAMAHTQKPDFVFRRNGRVHLNRRCVSSLDYCQVCASAVVMPDAPCSEVVWRVLATHYIRQFPIHFPSLSSSCAITFQLDSTWKHISKQTDISGSNAGYTMFRGSVKGTGYPLHSPVSPFTSHPLHHRVPSHFNWTLPENTYFKTDWHPCLRRDSNPQFQQQSGRRHTPYTARPLRWVSLHTDGFKSSRIFGSRQNQMVFKLYSEAGNSNARRESTRSWDFTSLSDETVDLSACYGGSQKPDVSSSMWLNFLWWRLKISKWFLDFWKICAPGAQCTYSYSYKET